MPKRPTISDEFRQRALNYGEGCWWPQNWNHDGDPPTYDEVLAHLIRLKELRLYALDHILKQQPGYEEGDENSPFYSEAYLYPLVGKEDARTILATLKTTIKMLEALLGKRFPIEIIF